MDTDIEKYKNQILQSRCKTGMKSLATLVELLTVSFIRRFLLIFLDMFGLLVKWSNSIFVHTLTIEISNPVDVILVQCRRPFLRCGPHDGALDVRVL